MGPPLLAPGEVVATSGRFPQPTKIPGKNYFKDEVMRPSHLGFQLLGPSVCKWLFCMDSLMFMTPISRW